MRKILLLSIFFYFPLCATQTIVEPKHVAPYVRVAFSDMRFIAVYTKMIKKYIWVGTELNSGSMRSDGSFGVQLHIRIVKRTKKNSLKYHSRSYKHYLDSKFSSFVVTVNFVLSANGSIRLASVDGP